MKTPSHAYQVLLEAHTKKYLQNATNSWSYAKQHHQLNHHHYSEMTLVRLLDSIVWYIKAFHSMEILGKHSPSEMIAMWKSLLACFCQWFTYAKRKPALDKIVDMAHYIKGFILQHTTGTLAKAGGSMDTYQT